MLEAVSSQVIRISSPDLSRGLANDCATRLIASVVPRVKMISRLERAFRNRRTRSRAPS
jgi:hypothetical protein